MSKVRLLVTAASDQVRCAVSGDCLCDKSFKG